MASTVDGDGARDDDVRALAERLLGEPVVGIDRLSEHQRRNYIARVRLVSGGTAIVKGRIGQDAERLAAFIADWAGPAFLTESGAAGVSHAPRFLGGDATAGLILLEDVAHFGTLADALVGSASAAAEAGLLSFAECLGRMHADTVPRLDAYARIAAELDPSADGLGWFGRYARGPLLEDARAELARIGVRADPEVWEELEEMAGTLAGPGPLRAYVHGDPCPDNILRTAAGLRLIDFEVGGIGLALLDGVYGEMAFPTCWCANRVPEPLVRRMETAYRRELVRGVPAAADDGVFDRAYAMACAAWLLPILRVAGRPDDRWGIASIQQRLVHRADQVARVCAERRCLPAVAGIAEEIAAHERQRLADLEPLPLYPPFR